MAYECLRLSDRYTLDFQEINPTSTQIGIYDFYVFNYHHATMAWLNTASLRQLPGKKFTLVLETLPGDPFVLCPSDVFDAYLVLDPTMDRPDDPRVYAFPRPLDISPALPPYHEPEVPIVGSFGFAIPGKGFELLVAAVNSEFEQAVVRINIPAGTFADNHLQLLHKCNYAAYLGDLCRRVAKLGIQVEITNEYMDKRQLIGWCGKNTLNCFMYNRNQPGISATTDQAISSGRPLAVSTNETFRHIHKYLRPYPFQSLKESIASAQPQVLQMRQDWAPVNFARRFEQVIEDCSLLPRSACTTQTMISPAATMISPAATILIVSHRAKQCGIHEYGNNIAGALAKSNKYRFVYAECSSSGELAQVIAEFNPSAIIYNYYPLTMPWLTPAITRCYSMPQLSIIHEVTQEDADKATTEMFDFHLCPDPTLIENNPLVFKTRRLIPPYLNYKNIPDFIIIGSFGFGFYDKGFERLIQQVQSEFDEAIIRLHMPFNDFVDPQGTYHALDTANRCRSAVIKPGIRLEISHHFMPKQELLDFLASNTLNAFFYDIHKHRGISSVIEHALAVQRPMAINKCGMFRHMHSVTPSICIEDTSMRDIIANDIAPLVPFYNDWSEANFIMDYERILDTVLSSGERRTPSVSGENVVDRAKISMECKEKESEGILQNNEENNQSRSFNRILDNKARELYKPVIDKLFSIVPEMMARKIPEANVQQAFVLDTVEKFAAGVTNPRILCVGAYEDTAAAGLKALGYRIDEIDPALNYDLNTFFNLPTTQKASYDIIFSTSVIEHVQDDQLFVRQIEALLAPGGVAVITCDYNDQYVRGDRIPGEDFRFYTQRDLRERLLPKMKNCMLVDEPQWDCPNPDFTYAGCHYTFATFVVRKSEIPMGLSTTSTETTKVKALASSLPRQVHIMDPAYNSVGHHPGLARSLARAFLARGYQPVFYVPKEIDPTVLAPYPCNCLFSISPYVNLYKSVNSACEKSSIALNRIVARDLSLFPFENVGSEDVIFASIFPNANSGFFPFFEKLALFSPRIRLATYQCLPSGLIAKNRGFVVVSDYALINHTAYTQASEILRQSILWGIASSIEAEAFAALSGLVFHTLPLAICGLPEDDSVIVPDGPTVNIGSLGGARLDKGIPLWPTLARLLLERHRNITYTFHFSGSYKGLGFEPVLSELRAMAANDHRIIILEGVLDEATYYNRLRNLDLFVMTHDPFFWQNLSSGSFCEAMYFGVPAVVPEGSPMADWVAIHGRHGESYTQQSPMQIADAVTNCVRDIQRLRFNRQNAAAAFRAHHGTEVLVDYILTHSPQTPVAGMTTGKPTSGKAQIFSRSNKTLPPLPGSIIDALPEQMNGAHVLDLGASDTFWATECLARGATYVQAVVVNKQGVAMNRETFLHNWATLINHGLIDPARFAITACDLYTLAVTPIGKFSHCLIMDQLNWSMDPFALLQAASLACTSDLIIECAVADGFSIHDVSSYKPHDYWGALADTRIENPVWLPTQAWLSQSLKHLGFGNISMVLRYPLQTPPGSGRILIKAQKTKLE